MKEIYVFLSKVQAFLCNFKHNVQKPNCFTAADFLKMMAEIKQYLTNHICSALQAPSPKFLSFWKVLPSEQGFLGTKIISSELIDPGPCSGNALPPKVPSPRGKFRNASGPVLFLH